MLSLLPRNLQKLPPETVEQFLSSRDPEALNIPPKLAEYILQLNEAANLLREHKYISECALKLKESYPDLSFSTCKNRIYDAIKYFNDSSNVTAPEWNTYFADQMMELYQKNMNAGDFREARLCMEKALEYYLAASANAIDPERTNLLCPGIVIFQSQNIGNRLYSKPNQVNQRQGHALHFHFRDPEIESQRHVFRKVFKGSSF